MRKRMIVLLAGAMLMMATSALAVPINSNRDFSVNGPAGGELSLQRILSDNFGGKLDAITDQSSQAIWQTTDGSPAAYAVAFMKGDAGNFGIYSYSSGQEVTLMTNPTTTKQTTFNINEAGTLVNGNGDILAEHFGSSFGFFWKDTAVAGISYTEDSKNAANSGWGADKNIRALTYLVQDGTKLTGTLKSYFSQSGQIAKGNDDWVMAFEDRGKNIGGDGDFQDAVFYVKDLAPVPEPGTMMLFGIGMLGMAIYGKRRMNKSA